MQNVNAMKRRPDGLRGITTVRGRWKAQISIHGRQVQFGNFSMKEQAAAAYDIQARLIMRMQSATTPAQKMPMRQYAKQVI